MKTLKFLQLCVSIVAPSLVFADDAALDTADVVDFASRDTNRIVGNITRSLARRTPFIDILDGGNVSNVSDVIRSIVQEQAVLNQSLVRPVFTDDKDMCGKTGEGAQVGSTEYSYKLQTLRGMGPLICVKQTRTAFMGSYESAEDSLRKGILKLINADVRSVLTDRSGTKLTVRAGHTLSQMYDGALQSIDTPFSVDEGVPDAPLNWRLLRALGVHQREVELVDGFEGTASEPLLRFIGGQEIIDRLRDEAEIRDDFRYIAAGSYQVGKDTLTRYRWEGPYRGYAFGVDPQPLRFSVLTNTGQPLYIEPEVAVETDNGVASKANPLWVRARYEIALVAGADSFTRLTPTSWNGEGNWKFPPQLYAGQLKFKVVEDNDDNFWGDYGRHAYQISRAYKPLRPGAITAIAFKRAATDYDLSTVADFTDYSSANAI